MNQRAIQDLIEDYLLDRITPEEKKRLLAMIDVDPDLDQYVKESEAAFKVLQDARERELRRKLKKWDAGMVRAVSWKRKALLVASVLIILLVAVWCWLGYRYAPEHLAMRSFISLQKNEFVFEANQDELEAFSQGSAAFREKNFENAMLIWSSIPFDPNSAGSDQIRWQLLLCRLALYGSGDPWIKDLTDFSLQASLPYQPVAKALLRDVQSPWYRLVNRNGLLTSMKAVKPKII